MKKVFTFLFAALMALTTFAQTNLAEGKASIATSGNAALGNDGSTGTRWESNSSDPQIWQVDLGEATDFNAIRILWEGAYGKTFAIEAGNTVDGDGYLTDGTVIATVVDQVISGSFPATQVLYVDNCNYRYVQFHGTARGTQWGYSFWELGVYNLPADQIGALASMKLAAAANETSVGTPVALTVQSFDVLGGEIANGEISYVLGNSNVGNVVDGQFVPTAAGTTTIKAVCGDVESNEISISVAAGQKIDLMTNNDLRVFTLGLATNTSMVGAFDDNDGSVWDMLGHETGGDETSRTYDVGFIADLRGLYDISQISIHFEGACSEAFTLAFAGEDGVFGEPVYTGGATGINNHTESFSGQSVTNARYVKFLSTKAATQWSVKIFDFAVYGTLKAQVNDAEAPVITNLTATGGDDAVTLNVTATDNSSKYIAYEVNGSMYGLGTSKAGEPNEIVIGNLNGGTTYDFSVVAIDAFGNRSAASSVTASTTGTAFVLTAAPVPTVDAANVKSLYSNAYSPATTYQYGWWSQSTATSTETVDGDEMIHLTNYNYLGFEFASDIDLSDMEYIHIDILPRQAMNFGITPIMRNAPTENSTLVGTLNVDEWNSIDLPLSAIGLTYTDNAAFQLKIDRGTSVEELYIDNIYFYKSAGETPAEVTAITIEASANELEAGKTLQLSVKDQDGNPVTTGLTFTSTSDEVATVDETGLVTAVAEGTAKIIATYVAPTTATGAPARAAGDPITAEFDLTVTAPVPVEGQVLTANGHTVTVAGYHHLDTDTYELRITSDEQMVGLGGSFWHINGNEPSDIRTNMEISDDGHTIICTAVSNADPQLYTPLYVLMPGEVNFGQITINWIEIGGMVDVTNIKVDTNKDFKVYSIDGRVLQRGGESLIILPAGIYVINGKKVVVK